MAAFLLIIAIKIIAIKKQNYSFTELLLDCPEQLKVLGLEVQNCDLKTISN